ncbi:MAG TPA: GNAT family N-acetyltransferase, partial [Anaerolineales bacterium]
DQDQRIDIEFPKMRREVTPHVVRHAELSGQQGGVVLYSRLDEANAEAVIRAQIRHFEGIGQDFEWKVYDYDRPVDLKERLRSLGFVIEEAEAIMVLSLAEAPPTLWEPIAHDVRRLSDAQELAPVIEIHQQVWDEDFSWLKDYLGEALREYPEQMSVYVAYIGGQPASSAWVYFPKHSQFASLWGGSTLSGFRKQGLYTALLAVRAQEARARGLRYLTVDASPMSRPILEKFGFEMIAYSWPCKWTLKQGKSSAAP